MPSSHEARSVPWQSCCIGTLQYHTNPCVQIVTDAALINSTTAATAGLRLRHAAGLSAGRAARESPLPALRQFSNRCITAKNGGTKNNPQQGRANIPVENGLPLDNPGP